MLSYLRMAMLKAKVPLRAIEQVLEIIETSKMDSISPYRRYIIIADNMSSLRISASSEIDRPETNLSIDIASKTYYIPGAQGWKKIIPDKTPSSESESA